MRETKSIRFLNRNADAAQRSCLKPAPTGTVLIFVVMDASYSDQESYPLLKDVFRERAEGVMNRRLPHALGLGAVCSIIALMGIIGGDFSHVPMVALIGVLYAVISAVVYKGGLNNFDRIWEKNIAKYCTALN